MAVHIEKLHKIAKQYELKSHMYKDLKLDFERSNRYNTTTNKKLYGNDIEVDYDESAIKNSLRNLFNTKPGQRFLFPLYGLDLYQYVFESITNENARLIGEKIVNSVKLYEPRVNVVRCDIEPQPDNNTYDINLIVEIPALRTVTSINSMLDTTKKSFIFIETSRNK